MPSPFVDLYASLLKNDVFTVQAQENIAQGADGLTCALAYAEQGKPEFTLAYLLLTDISDEEKFRTKGRTIRFTIPSPLPSH